MITLRNDGLAKVKAGPHLARGDPPRRRLTRRPGCSRRLKAPPRKADPPPTTPCRRDRCAKGGMVDGQDTQTPANRFEGFFAPTPATPPVPRRRRRPRGLSPLDPGWTPPTAAADRPRSEPARRRAAGRLERPFLALPPTTRPPRRRRSPAACLVPGRPRAAVAARRVTRARRVASLPPSLPARPVPHRAVAARRSRSRRARRRRRAHAGARGRPAPSAAVGLAAGRPGRRADRGHRERGAAREEPRVRPRTSPTSPTSSSRCSRAAAPTCTSPPARRPRCGCTATCTPIPDQPVLTPAVIQKMIYAALSQKQREKFEENLELDFAYSVPGQGPLPGQRLPPARRARGGVPAHPVRDQAAGDPRGAARR